MSFPIFHIFVFSLKNKNLKIIKGDIRNLKDYYFKRVDSVIHLANIANDPAVELNPVLSWEVNVLAGQQLADRAVRAGVKQFLFASSGSVYGVKEEAKVTEDLTLVPISVYNKTKMVGEKIVESFNHKLKTIILEKSLINTT